MRLKRLQPILLASLLSSPLFAGFDSMNPLQSTTHTANTASQNTQIALSWNQAIPNDSDNLGGYYYILDQNESTLIPTVVDTRSTLGVSATSITVTAPNEGTFYFHLAPYADSGNIGATLHFKFIKIDTTAPTALSISPDGGSFNSVQTVSMSATDVNSYTIYYTTDNSDPSANSTVYSAPFTLSSSQTIKSMAIDSAGNTTPIVSSAFTITHTSNVAQFGNEVTAGSTIATNNSGGSSSFVPSITVDGALVTEYKFKIDTTSYSAQIVKDIPIDISGLQDGLHTISILGYDGTSLQLESEATTLSFSVDNTAPDSVTFSTPSGTEITSDTTITMSSTNSDSIYYTTDGSIPNETSTNSTTVALTSANNGTFTLRAISYDSVHNKSSVQEAIYTVDITASTDNDSSSGGTTPPPAPPPPADNNSDTDSNNDSTDNSVDDNIPDSTDDNATSGDDIIPDENPATDENSDSDDNPASGGEEPTTDDNPASGEEEPTADDNPASGEEEPTADDNPASGGEEPTADDNPASGGEEPTADDNPASGGEEPTADDNPASGGEEPTADDNPASGGEDPTADDNPASGEEEPTADDNSASEEEEPTADNDSASGEEEPASSGNSTASITLPFTTDSGSHESVNIDSDVTNTTQTTNSDGSVTVTASIGSIKNELQVHTNGTLNSATTIGSETSTIEVNTVGADTQFNADGSVVIVSTLLGTAGSSISSNVEVKANGEMINTLNITVKDGTSTQSVIKSDIAGTDTVVADDGSMTMTTPTITTAKNQKVDFEIVLNVLGEVVPSLSVDGTAVSLPQFEAGSVVSIKKELNKILLTIETLLTQSITFN